MKSIDIPTEYRKLYDDSGYNYLANYSAVMQADMLAYRVRVGICNPNTHKLALNKDFPDGNRHKRNPSAPHYVYHTGKNIEECYAFLPCAMAQLRLNFEGLPDPFENAAMNETIASRYETCEVDFFEYAKRAAWHNAKTRKAYRAKLEKLKPRLAEHRIGELCDAALATRFLEEIAPHPETCNADYVTRQILARLCDYFSAILQLPICAEAMICQCHAKSSRSSQILANYGIQRSLPMSAIQRAYSNLLCLSPNAADWNVKMLVGLGLLGGPRTAECAAITFGSLKKQVGGFSLLAITSQLIFSNEKWHRSNVLKTCAAFRELVLPHIISNALEARCAWLAHLYRQKDLSSYPIFGQPNDFSKALTPAQINALLKPYLYEIGVTDATIQAFHSLQQFERLQEDRAESLCYYTLRRTFITMLHTVLALPDSYPADAACSYLAGHARTSAQKAAVGNKKPPHAWQASFCQCLDQYISWLTNCPEQLSLSTSGLVIPSVMNAVLKMPRKGTAHICLEQTEPGTQLLLDLRDAKGNPLPREAIHCFSHPVAVHDAYCQGIPIAVSPFVESNPPNADPDVAFLLTYLGESLS